MLNGLPYLTVNKSSMSMSMFVCIQYDMFCIRTMSLSLYQIFSDAVTNNECFEQSS